MKRLDARACTEQPPRTSARLQRVDCIFRCELACPCRDRGKLVLARTFVRANPLPPFPRPARAHAWWSQSYTGHTHVNASSRSKKKALVKPCKCSQDLQGIERKPTQ
eukprot:6184639-Pleurochrysis_carterae.AAC.1